MGRLRIKKKDAVLPFRDTMAYRLLLATAAMVVLMVTMYFLIYYFRSGNNIGIIVSIAATVMAVTALFYNLGELRNAKIPASTLKRSKRR